MEAATRPSLEPLADLPLETPVETARPPAAKEAPASAPPAAAGTASDSSSTGITFLDPASLLLDPGTPESSPAAPPAPVAPAPAEPEIELVLEDPAVVEELLTAPPPPKPPVTPPPAASPAAPAAAAAPESMRTERVPLMRTASLSASATKAAAGKLAAATKRAAETTAPKSVAPASIPVARPAPQGPKTAAPKPAEKGAEAPAQHEGLAAWTNARSSAAPAKPKSPPPAAPAAPRPAAAPVAAAPSAKAAAPKAAPAGPAPAAAPSAAAPSAPMDRDFIARNQVVERYLSGRLPIKGATEFEQFVRNHPELLDEIGLPERVNAGLRLLEASGKPEPWQEAPRPAWQKPQVTLALGAAAVVLAVALMAVTGNAASKSHRIEQLQKQVTDQPLDPATSTREIRLLPSREGATNAPAITVGAGGAQLADLKIDESRSPYHIFRVTIDRIDQGRVGVISNLVKDSNGHLRIALNTTALGPGNYQLSIEGLNWRGDPEPDSWVTIGIAR